MELISGLEDVLFADGGKVQKLVMNSEVSNEL
jgi:hypothetical protein